MGEGLGGRLDVVIGAPLPAGTNDIGDVDVLSVVPGVAATSLGKAEDAVHGSGDTGVMALAVRRDDNTALAADLDYIPITTDVSGALRGSGNRAHDETDSGNPLKAGMKAVDFDATPTAVAADDRTDWYANRHGIPWVLGGHMNGVSTEFTFTTAQTNTALVTVGAGTAIVVTLVAVTLGADAAAAGFRLGFAAATLPAAASSS